MWISCSSIKPIKGIIPLHGTYRSKKRGISNTSRHTDVQTSFYQNKTSILTVIRTIIQFSIFIIKIRNA